MSLASGHPTEVGAGKLFPAQSLVDASLASELTRYRRAVTSRYRPLPLSDLGELPKGRLLVTPKVDGELWFAVTHPAGVSLVAPNGRVLEGSLPLLQELGKHLGGRGPGLVVAGELFALRKTGRPRVGDVARALGGTGDPATLGFMAFDIVKPADGETLPEDWATRHEALSLWLADGKRAKPIPVEEATDADGVQGFYTDWVESEKAEGLVVRSADGRIFKIKPLFSIDCAVVGFTERAGEVEQVRSLLLALQREDQTFQLVGAVGNVGSEQDRRDLYSRIADTVVGSDYRAVAGSGAMYRFVSPRVVVEVQCTDLQTEDIDGVAIRQWALRYDDGAWTRVGPANGASLIHPSLVRVRDDKEARLPDVRIDQLLDRTTIPALDEPAEPDALPASQVIRREVFTKETKGVTAVRKLLVWQTNKADRDPDFPAYVVHWTDYSPGRKTPLEREVRPAPTAEDAERIADNMLEKGVKAGWKKWNEGA